MTAAQSIDKRYTREIEVNQSSTNGIVWNTNSQNVRESVRFVLTKPASVKTIPQSDGFRLPQPWLMNTRTEDRYFRGCTFVTKSKSGPNWTRQTGPLNIATPPTFTYGTWPAALTAQTEISALLKMKNAEMSLGASFGERKEGVALMYDRLASIARAYKAFKRGELKDAARHLRLSWRDIPNTWLEFKLGWLPMLSDIHSACEVIDKKDQQNPNRVSYFVKASLNDEEIAPLAGAGSSGFGYSGFRRIRRTCQVRWDFWPGNDSPIFRTLDEYGVVNPVEVAWELAPLSFVLDWAVPVGDFLSAFSATKGYRFRSGSRSQFIRVYQKVEAVPAPAAYVNVLLCTGKAQAKGVAFQRLVYSGFPMPSFAALGHLHYKNTDVQATRERAATGLSLLASAFSE
jgi:hypothetical protein